MWSFFLLFYLHIMFAAVYPFCCKTKLLILWSMIYCERLFKQSVILKCVTCSRYQAAFYISILALNTRSSIHVFGCKQTTCQAPGYLTQDFNETHISCGGLRLGGCQAMPKAAADHKSSDTEGGTWSWLHAVHVPEGHRSMREICLSWYIMA